MRILFLVIDVALAVCAELSRKSGKHIGKAASVLLFSLVFPVFGNGMIIVSEDRTISLIGCYMYYLGLDVSIAALLHYTFEYCQISWLRIFLRKLVCGFLIEMDDFGSGYSSLNLLREIPVDVLKIDMVFLRNVADHERERSRAIVNGVISMAKQLGITSLTEGVETEYQFSRLREMGCQLYQGFYFAKPMPVEEFDRITARA